MIVGEMWCIGIRNAGITSEVRNRLGQIGRKERGIEGDHHEIRGGRNLRELGLGLVEQISEGDKCQRTKFQTV